MVFLNTFRGCCQAVIDRDLPLLSILGVCYEDYPVGKVNVIPLDVKDLPLSQSCAHRSDNDGSYCGWTAVYKADHFLKKQIP